MNEPYGTCWQSESYGYEQVAILQHTDSYRYRCLISGIQPRVVVSNENKESHIKIGKERRKIVRNGVDRNEYDLRTPNRANKEHLRG